MVNKSSKRRRRENSSNSDESESENEFQVEAILDKRTKGKKVQYLLKWKGYSDADNTVSTLSSTFLFWFSKQENHLSSNRVCHPMIKSRQTCLRLTFIFPDNEKLYVDEFHFKRMKKNPKLWLNILPKRKLELTRSKHFCNLNISMETSSLFISSSDESNPHSIVIKVNLFLSGIKKYFIVFDRCSLDNGTLIFSPAPRERETVTLQKFVSILHSY